MSLFLDGDGIPLAFDITSGNTNEEITLMPLEEKIINDFKTSKFVVCTHAGLASISNRKFNNTNNRRFIATQSLKKLKSFLKEEALDLTKGGKLFGSDKIYDISKLREDEVEEIIAINKNRWEIEESFRIMKSEFKSRPVYLSRDDKIKAHFKTCFLTLVIYRYLEIDREYTISKLIETLK